MSGRDTNFFASHIFRPASEKTKVTSVQIDFSPSQKKTVLAFTFWPARIIHRRRMQEAFPILRKRRKMPSGRVIPSYAIHRSKNWIHWPERRSTFRKRPRNEISSVISTCSEKCLCQAKNWTTHARTNFSRKTRCGAYGDRTMRKYFLWTARRLSFLSLYIYLELTLPFI